MEVHQQYEQSTNGLGLQLQAFATHTHLQQNDDRELGIDILSYDMLRLL
ncbi:MAG TPA: hypothetical protein VFB12_10910 [Ktedonobacteraceae bacterium]|nr:hypothetical protein [Ktedonobacteraceae bacterium]